MTDPDLERDGIHLKNPAGDRFLGHISECVQAELASLSDTTFMDEDGTRSESSIETVSVPSGSEASLSAILRIVQGNSLKLNIVRPLKKSFDQLVDKGLES